MRKTIHKWFWAWDFEKEEMWLNEMAAKGLALVAVGFGAYTFEESLTGEYNIRLELLENLPSHSESAEYIKFLEDTGVEYLGSITRWVYFRKKTDCGEFNLYSDNKSRIKHLERLMLLLGILALSQLLIGFSNVMMYFESGSVSSLGIGIFSLCFALMLGNGYLQITRKKVRLKKELQLFE